MVYDLNVEQNIKINGFNLLDETGKINNDLLNGTVGILSATDVGALQFTIQPMPEKPGYEEVEKTLKDHIQALYIFIETFNLPQMKRDIQRLKEDVNNKDGNFIIIDPLPLPDTELKHIGEVVTYSNP